MPSDETVIVKELRDRNAAELSSLLEAKKEDLHQAKFSHALGQLRETHRLRQLKRDIARLTTVLKEKQIAALRQDSGQALGQGSTNTEASAG